MAQTTRLPILFGIALLLATGGPTLAQQSPLQIFKTLNFESGKIPLGDNLATLDLQSGYRFLNNLDTQTFLTKIYDNPPGAGRNALGLIIPTDVDPLSAEGWVIIVQYENSGYVSDSDASTINYNDLLKEMQKETENSNPERIKQGYEKIELLGWAQRPYYDANAKKLYWAKRLHFGNSQDDTLNYEIRILGRRGVLDLNVVGGMNVLAVVNQRVNSILSMVHFNSGNTYAEYKPGVDKAAAYGVAGLIAGGVLAKAGFFKALLVLLAGAWKLVGAIVIGAFAALSAFLKNLFRRRSKPANPLPATTTEKLD